MTLRQVAIGIALTFGLFGTIDPARGHFIRRHCECCLPACGAPSSPSCESQSIPACDCAGETPALVSSPAATAGEPSKPAPAAGTKPPIAPTPALPTPTPQPKLHALLVVDDLNRDAGAANLAGAAQFEAMLRAGVSAHRLGSVVTLKGSSVTPDRIRSAIGSLPVRSQDTLICFYSGSMEYDDGLRTFVLNPTAAGRSRLSRNDLRSALLDRKARLTGLLTDAPANRVKLERLPEFPLPTGSFSIENLVFHHRGIMDVHAASATEQAFSRGDSGGLFTLALVQELEQLKPNAPPVVWPELFDRVRRTTDSMYVELRRAVLTSDRISDEDKRIYRDQPHQTPTALTPLDQVQPAPRPSTSPGNARPAELLVRVPAGATILIEDRSTTQSGPVRVFETAPLSANRDYTYSVRAELHRAGRSVNEVKQVTVRAGEVVELRFESLNAVDSQPATALANIGRD